MRTQSIDRIRLLGRAITPDLIRGTSMVFSPDALRPETIGCEAIRDLPYGEDPRHRLDVFVPAKSEGARPILLFVHGGGFVTGQKGGAGDAFYNNVGAWAASRGWVGATMNYRLAPGSTWPAGAEDVQRAIAWLHENAREWAGSEEPPIIVLGQSAGAVHVAGAVARLKEDDARPAGIAMLSGLFDLTTLTHSDLERIYFGRDAQRFEEQSSLNALLTCGIPCFHTVSELDPPTFQQQAARLVQVTFEATGQWPELHYLAGHNHLSPVQAIGSADDDVGPLLECFVAKCVSRRSNGHAR